MSGTNEGPLSHLSQCFVLVAAVSSQWHVMANAGWHDPKSVGFSGWKIGETIRGVNRQVQVVFETSWYHSIELERLISREFFAYVH